MDEILLKTYVINDKTYYVIFETDYNNSHYYILSNEVDKEDIIIAELIDNHVVPLEDNSLLKELMKLIIK